MAYLIAGFSVFGPFLDNPFLMDDEIQVTQNSLIQDITKWPSYFTQSTMAGGGMEKMNGVYYKPLMTLFYAVTWHFAGEDPLPFRAIHLLLHLSSAFLLFLLIKRFFPPASAFVAGLLFVLHPVNSEVVAYIADAQDVLYMFFGLLAVWLCQQSFLRGWRTAFLGLVLLCSVLSKETGALFFALVPLFVWLFERERFKAVFACTFIAGLIYLGLRINSGLMSFEHPALLIHRASLLERLQTVPLIFAHYLEIALVPWRITTITDFVLKDLTFTNFILPLCVASAFGIGLRVIWKRLKSETERKIFVFASSVMGLWFLLHGNAIIPLDGTYADRWFYLGLIGFLFFILLLLPRNFLTKKIAVASVTVIVVLFAARTWVRLEDWETPSRLYEREYTMRPFDTLMANNVGVELFKKGEVAASQTYFEKATQNNPVWDVGWSNLGATYQRQNKIDEALRLYEKAISLGTYHLAYENYAALRCALATDEACRNFVARAVQIFPHNGKLQEIARFVQSSTQNPQPTSSK